MSYALLPENVTSSFVKELRELSQNHHKYEINRLLNKNANYGGLKKSKEEILAIAKNGNNFFSAVNDLYNIMQEAEAEFFKSILTKAALVMQAPTKKNREALRAEFNRFKAQVHEYKNSHPFSTGLGNILINSLALTLGIALVITSIALAAPVSVPGIVIGLGQVLMSSLGVITTVISANMLAQNASMHYRFFKNEYEKRSESFINDIDSDDYEEYLKHAQFIGGA
ncbi:hypothetical protein Lste_0851 [Legionella steelei]|uniref:DUF5638 domain-containing protein n=1 Tax=Legionella steelei TaxID=947033 RepID=A0A0W0ZEP5_9GAMM|nr:hypothetical protein [Legionella steelei]KTD67693.1 hypothetical protein Lste_0851 [Legionella steelei]